MTKLEEKLIELGYEKPNLPYANGHEISKNDYIKEIQGTYIIKIKVIDNKIKDYFVVSYPYLTTTKVDANIYRDSWFILYKDLEVLKKYETR